MPLLRIKTTYSYDTKVFTHQVQRRFLGIWRNIGPPYGNVMAAVDFLSMHKNQYK